MKKKRIIPYVPPEDRCKLHEGCGEKFYLSDGISSYSVENPPKITKEIAQRLIDIKKILDKNNIDFWEELKFIAYN